MYIDPKSMIVGCSALKIRDLMRKIGDRSVPLDDISYYLKINKEASREVTLKLLDDGYIEIDEKYSSKKTYYKTTLKGNSLSLASAAKPLTRKTAERKLSEFMSRVKNVNSQESYLYKVSKVLIFGSYLSEKDRINDIDIAVEVLPKFESEEQQNRNQNFTDEAMDNGKRFSSFIDQLFYPEMEVLKYLKSRSRAISLHRTSDAILDQVEQKVIYHENIAEPGV